LGEFKSYRKEYPDDLAVRNVVLSNGAFGTLEMIVNCEHRWTTWVHVYEERAEIAVEAEFANDTYTSTLEMPKEFVDMFEGKSFMPYTLVEKDQILIRLIPTDLLKREFKRTAKLRTVTL